MIRYRTTDRPQLFAAVVELKAAGWDAKANTSLGADWISVVSDRDPGDVEGAVLAVLPDAIPLDSKPV